MSFLRPELAAWLIRWREPVGWSVLVVFSVWWIVTGAMGQNLFLLLLGFVVGAPATIMLLGSIRRVHLSSERPAEGVVTIDEGRIGYFGPHGGGFVDTLALAAVELVSLRDGGHAWALCSRDGNRLIIPIGASGAERLPGALSLLPGISMNSAANAARQTGPGRTVVWQNAGYVEEAMSDQQQPTRLQ